MKKRLRYKQALRGPVVGQRADIELIDDHPDCETKLVSTSQVVKVEDNGNFETLNTEYVKADA